MQRLLFLLLIGLAATEPVAAQSAALPGYTYPGRLVDIGGRRLYLYCSGSGGPTVVLAAGGGAFSIDWDLVQGRVAQTMRVCSYDRAGLGWSDPGPAEETVEETVDDLHLLLRAAGETGPFILGGASISGIFIRAYQHLFPGDVAALVFLNSSHRVGMRVNGKTALLWEFSEDELRSGFPLPPTATKGPPPTHEGDPFDRLPASLQAARLGFDVQLWEKSDPSRAGPASLLSWRKEFLREFEEQEAARGAARPLGSLPVVVVASDTNAIDPVRARRQMDDLVSLSSNSIHIVAKGSGHEIHLYQPDVVVQALERAVRAVRKGARLSDHTLD